MWPRIDTMNPSCAKDDGATHMERAAQSPSSQDMPTASSESERKGRVPSEAAGGIKLYFALVAPRVGEHHTLLGLLQCHIVAPMVAKESLSEFRVISATPPSFVADSCTVLVFELIVQSVGAITDREVRAWRAVLDPFARLIVASPPRPRKAGYWDLRHARSILARAMAIGGGLEKPNKSLQKDAAPVESRGFFSPQRYFEAATTCLTRSDALGDDAKKPVTFGDGRAIPLLHAWNGTTGTMERVGHGATLLNEDIAAALCRHLPATVQWRTLWRLAYSPRIHGVSLKTFLRNMEDEPHSILLVQDHHGKVFGGFAPEAWHITDRYYGSGESFVFTLSRRLPKAPHLSPHTPRSSSVARSSGTDQNTTQHHSTASRQERTLEEESLEDAASDTAARHLVDEAVNVMRKWQDERRAQAKRSEKMLASHDLVSSPTEALDEMFRVFAGEADILSANGTVGRTSDGVATRSAATAFADEEGQGNDEEEEEEEADPLEPGEDVGLQVFSGTTTDPFFMFSDGECLAMGGGSTFALFLEKDLLHGMSERCSTFSSSMLSSKQNFIVNELECWAFCDPSDL